MRKYKVFLDGREAETLQSGLDTTELSQLGAKYGAVLRGMTYRTLPSFRGSKKEIIYRFETVKSPQIPKTA